MHQRMWRRAVSCGFLALFLGTGTGTVLAGEWLRFRGPNGTGVNTDAKALPAKWSATENMKWMVKLPGPGHSSPILVGNRIFLTCWTGYGLDQRDPGDQTKLRRHLLCLDRATGKTLWSREVEPVLPEDRYNGMFAEHGYATHTPVSDGKRVFVFYGMTGVLAYDVEGKQLWHTNVGLQADPRRWGSSSSPILYKDLVIVTASVESNSLVALHKDTGKQVWRQEAAGFGSTWGTPTLVEVDKDRTDLVIGVPNEIWGFNPDTGKLRWYCEAQATDSYCSCVVAEKGVVYGIEGMSGGSVAVRVGGEGDVTRTHLVWSGRDRNRVGTPLVHEGRIYFISNRMANCIDAQTGKRIYQERLAGGGAAAANPMGGFGGAGGGRRGGFGGGQDYSSLVAADGKLFYLTRNGTAHVLKLGAEFQQLSVNQFASEDEDFSATPAIGDGALYIRSSKYLYCIANSN